MEDFPQYVYRGARASLILQVNFLREFVETWKKAKAKGVVIPETDDPDYASLETMLRHVLWWARYYLQWISEKLDLPDPEELPLPDVEKIEDDADLFIDRLCSIWYKSSLSEVPEEKFYVPLHTAKWKVDYCIDAMLEHAALHPKRHQYQLLKFMEK